MQIEEEEHNEDTPDSGCCSCFSFCFCRKTYQNPDLSLKPNGKSEVRFIKNKNRETGYLVPHHKKRGTCKTMEMLRLESAVTKYLPSPEEIIKRSYGKKTEMMGFLKPIGEINVSDVNNLLRRRLSLSVSVSDSNESGEMGEAIFPHRSTLSEAAPILLSQLVKNTSASKSTFLMVNEEPSVTRRRSSFNFKSDIEKFRSSFQGTNGTSQQQTMEGKSDEQFLDSLAETSNFMKEVLEKDWDKTKGYIKWLQAEVQNEKYSGKTGKVGEKWMVVLYTGSDRITDQLMTFRSMLVRLLLQHHCVAYTERDVSLPQFQAEYKERLGGEKSNVPQVYMRGLCLGGYRVIYAIHKMGLAQTIFKKFIIPAEQYSEWMFKKESKKSQLTLEVNLKVFPALQALSGSSSNEKLAPEHLEFATLGKMVVKRAREQWYRLSSNPYSEPDLRRYALYRLTILHALIAMNKVYTNYLIKNKTKGDESPKNRRRLSWLPRMSKVKG